MKKLLFILLMGLFLASCNTQKAKFLSIGDKAPDFTLMDLNGKNVSLKELLDGREVILNFWATWCPTCVKEMPELDKFASEYKDKVRIIGINAGETKDKVSSFVSQLSVKYPILLDKKSEVVKMYGISILPTIIVVNKDGLIKNLSLDIRGMESYLRQN